MKRAFQIAVVGLVTLTLILSLKDKSSLKYPTNHPKMIVEYNGETFEAGINELTWVELKIPDQTIGNSQISINEIDVANEMKSISVNASDILNLKLTYDKNISSIEAIEVSGIGTDRKTTPVDIVDYTVRAPAEKGEHIYSVKLMWDSTPQSYHYVSYVIKLNVV